MVYSGFWRRVGAGLIDVFILQMATGIILFFFGIGPFDWIINSNFYGSLEGENNLQIMIAGLIMSFCYYSFFQSSKYQATLGMKFFSIRVVGYDGNGISFLTAFGRFLATYLSAIALCIGYLMIAFTPRKQGLHDYLAKTLVVKD